MRGASDYATIEGVTDAAAPTPAAATDRATPAPDPAAMGDRPDSRPAERPDEFDPVPSRPDAGAPAAPAKPHAPEPQAHPEPLRRSPRAVDWDGFYNARDLGGLPTRDGGVTLTGAFVRSADLRFATEAGLEAAREAGVRTVVDLRNAFETRPVARSAWEERANAYRVPATREAELPDGVFGIRVPLDNTSDRVFWDRMREERRLGNPRFFRPVIEQQPQRVVAVLRAIAASPDAVVYHCAVGRDRTGLVTFALLSLADVEPEAIADDYAESAEELGPFFSRLDFPDPKEVIEASLAEHGLTVRTAVLEELDGFDPWTALTRAGLTEAELQGLRARLRGGG
ncbi:hypothetical protein GCM10011490_15370 [Pseudoclavibacter endophyticus]|nr:hypothetical protein GCM10011490_15370 [Pseudoclavibacter endophyticus]